MAAQIYGTVAPGFELVKAVFADNFALRGEVGASVSAYIDGQRVVHLWAGVADTESSTPWTEDTMATMFSATKGLVALAFLMLEDRGTLSLDTPIAHYWPEFAAAGKASITIRTLLNHRAGLCAVDAPIELSDLNQPERVDALLAAQVPLWQPGKGQGYGATAFGLYTQSLFRRITGESLGTFLEREVFKPLKADVWLGLPGSQNPRVATTYPVEPKTMVKEVLPHIVKRDTTEGRVYGDVLMRKKSPSSRAFLNPKMGPERLSVVNKPLIRAMELPWMNAISTADGLARVYGALGNGGTLDGHKLVTEEAISRLAPKQSWSNNDRVLHKPMGFSQGFVKEQAHLISPNEAAFGHTGAGGTVGFADPTHKLGMAYLMNRMDHHIRSPRCIELCRAMYQCLGYT